MRPGRLLNSDDAVAESNGFTDVVGHEENRQTCFSDDAFELAVQQVTGDRVERAERLVHQQHVGILREGTGQRDALTHAAGKLVRPRGGEAGEADNVEQFGHSAAPLRPWVPCGPATPTRCCRPRSATGTAPAPET